MKFLYNHKMNVDTWDTLPVGTNWLYIKPVVVKYSRGYADELLTLKAVRILGKDEYKIRRPLSNGVIYQLLLHGSDGHTEVREIELGRHLGCGIWPQTPKSFRML